jgi:hypothetical protein
VKAIARVNDWFMPPVAVGDETRGVAHERLVEWLEVGPLILLTGIALIALAIPIVLVTVSMFNVVSWVIGGAA